MQRSLSTSIFTVRQEINLATGDTYIEPSPSTPERFPTTKILEKLTNEISPLFQVTVLNGTILSPSSFMISIFRAITPMENLANIKIENLAYTILGTAFIQGVDETRLSIAINLLPKTIVPITPLVHPAAPLKVRRQPNSAMPTIQEEPIEA